MEIGANEHMQSLEGTLELRFLLEAPEVCVLLLITSSLSCATSGASLDQICCTKG